MVSLFDYRATNPNDMMEAQETIGPENDSWIKKLANDAAVFVGAWGNSGTFMNRSMAIRNLIPNVKCLKQNKTGAPIHPLFQKRSTTPISISLYQLNPK